MLFHQEIQIAEDVSAPGAAWVGVDPAADVLQWFHAAAVRQIIQGKTPANHRTILIVEDDPDLRAILKDGFEAHGYLVDLALTGGQALERSRRITPEVIVLDYHLPDRSGELILGELRQRHPFAPVIMMTGDPQPKLAVRWMSLGASAYVRKPFELDYLLQLCERTCRERALLRVEDILEQRTQQLREQEEKYRTVADFTVDWEYWIGPDGRFRYVSPSCERITGFRPAEFYSDPALLLRMVHPDDREKVAAHLQSSPAQKGPAHLEFRVLAHDGREVFIDHWCQPICREDGTYLGHRAGNTDITDRKRAEEALKRSQGDLLAASRLAGMAEVATSVLHNVGNVLNSINISTSLISDRLQQSRLAGLDRVAALLQEHAQDLAQFLTGDPRGIQLPVYLSRLAEYSANEHATLLSELDSLKKNVQHIKDIITVQQSYAKVGGVAELVKVADLVGDALRLNAGALLRHEVQVIREYDPARLPEINVEKHKVLQILVNLIDNAKYACQVCNRAGKKLTVRVAADDRWLRISIMDNGMGIPPENLTRIFSHGFTTRKGGHGFGLHSGALAAKELGGELRVHSDGPGLGAVFTLELPLSQRPTPTAG
jgi:PAS domain S-box-containing protein